jgi:hypothetical protein
MYVDSAYIAKYYVNEADSEQVRKLLRGASELCSSAWALVEVSCVLRRHVAEGSLTEEQGRELIELFRRHVEEGVWGLRPVSSGMLSRTSALVRSLPGDVALRAGDAIHVATALAEGEPAIWTNDRHLLAAARLVGLEGRSAGVYP